MKHIFILALALIFVLTLAACNRGKPGSAADDGHGDVIYEDDDRGDIADASEDTEAPVWEGAFAGLEINNVSFVITITEFSGTSFWFVITDMSDETVIYSGTANLLTDDIYAADYVEETTLTFSLDASSSVIILFADDDRLEGQYGIVNPDDRFDLGGHGDITPDEGGQGDIISG